MIVDFSAHNQVRFGCHSVMSRPTHISFIYELLKNLNRIHVAQLVRSHGSKWHSGRIIGRSD